MRTVWCFLLCVACGSGSDSVDAGRTDGPRVDGGRDGGVGIDSGSNDSGPADGGPPTAVFPERDFVCAAGETPVCMTTTPATSDSERTEVVRETIPGGTIIYVVSEWSAPVPAGGVAPGLNLDGLDSGAGSTAPDATCEEVNRDHASSLDPRHVGVDNALANVVRLFESFIDPSDCAGGSTDGCLDERVARAIAGGELLLLVEIGDVHDFVNDPEVSVAIHVASLFGGGMPMVDGSGRLAPDQTFEAVATLGTDESADIFRGRLRARFATWDWPATTSVTGLFMPGLGADLASVELRADLSESALANGNLGGHASIDEVIAVFGAIDPGMTSALRSAVAALCDIDPSAADATVCERMSVGYVVSGVRALRAL